MAGVLAEACGLETEAPIRASDQSDRAVRFLHASSRRDSRSHAATRVTGRNTNRGHMSGDHHG
jgi:hypothetical protein